VIRKLKVLDLDTEVLPGHWIGGDFVSKVMTAVAWKWFDSREAVQCMTHYSYTPEQMAEAIRDQIREADVVVGHYIRGFDLRIINGALMRGEHEPLDQVLAHDTKLDLLTTHGRSLSQKNLAAMLGIRQPKVDVNLTEWEGFNTRAPGFEAKGIERVKGDVTQNIALRKRLVELGWIGPPQLWDPARAKSARYHA